MLLRGAPPSVVWDSACDLPVFHKGPVGWFLQPISVLLNGSPVLKPINCFPTLLDESALHHPFQVIGNDIEQNKTFKQYIPSSLL